MWCYVPGTGAQNSSSRSANVHVVGPGTGQGPGQDNNYGQGLGQAYGQQYAPNNSNAQSAGGMSDYFDLGE